MVGVASVIKWVEAKDAVHLMIHWVTPTKKNYPIHYVNNDKKQNGYLDTDIKYNGTLQPSKSSLSKKIV